MPKLCIALDLPRDENLALCENLAKNNIYNIYLKIGLRSFIRDGVDFIKDLENLGFKIFLDLKLYDIPNTMLDSIREIMKLNVSMLTIHASSGRVAMREIGKLIKQCENPPLIFAVSALTSFTNDDFVEIYNTPLDKAILNLAKIVNECGIDGIVCSPLESKSIKDKFDLLTLTPGIRPIKSDFNTAIDLYDNSDDQNRTSSIKMAESSDFIVIGRPIYKHKNPIFITKQILSILDNKGC
ncbi:orotidine-5'-phosphate decarboxylase [Helicobacter sp. 16-1353]|uniref:orotidine-5'-phosphate decarboxylase n=1 Tax=Helicobacter sp. 16-1353 TaxID=2004996 RepID=UPI000DCBDF55|nr:orotidine-5'-phosphate decarboxylase [Helicobacter sp. 16-1353]RAX54896.1 orotidine-5'-phosphate decarboxylase [Helicobacter sp. 16-1353]